jgi:hypothetical protein
MTKVERVWFRIRAADQDVARLFPSDDEDFNDVDPTTAEGAMADLPVEWSACDSAVERLPLDHRIDLEGEPVSLASIYIHLIEEWARHNGHADLIRQSIDGTVDR